MTTAGTWYPPAALLDQLIPTTYHPSAGTGGNRPQANLSN